MEMLQEKATLPEGLPRPASRELLKLFFAASRLHRENQWGDLKVLYHEPLGLWALQGEHFSASFETCCTEVVVPVDALEPLSIQRHEALARALCLEALFYALVDTDGDVVLYAFRPASFLAPPDKRPLSEPAFVPGEQLAAIARGRVSNESADRNVPEHAAASTRAAKKARRQQTLVN